MNTPEEHALGVLRPALELALAVARRGAAESPPVPPPGPVRPLLRFAKLSDRALVTLRDCVEDSGEFRRRVVEAADPAAMGRLPYVWLTRPEGWTDELRTAEQQRSEVAAEVADERAERSARRRLVAVETALARAEGDSEVARRAAAEAAVDLAGQRSQRRRSEREAQDLSAALETMTRTVADLERALAEATTARRDLEALVDDAHHRIDDLIGERNEALGRARRAEEAAEDARSRMAARQRRADDVRSALGQAVEEAAGAARLLGVALASAAGALDGPAEPPSARLSVLSQVVDHGPGAGPGVPVAAGPAMAPAPLSAARPRRQAVPLPPAVFDDSPEAAEFLSRVGGTVMLVDGYNVSLSGWGHEDLAAQRRYLVNRLATLATRTSLAVRVIFDGAESHELPPPPGKARAVVRVAFSPAGVDADEVIIDLVEELPVTTPVLVATSDRRVAGEVARRGANVISAHQLLALLGRPLTS